MSKSSARSKRARVARRRAGDEQHGKPGRERCRPRARAPATQNRPWYCDGGQYAQDLVDGARDLLVVVDDLLPLVGVPREQHDRVADELRHGLRAGAAEQRGEAGDLDVVEAGLLAVAAVDGDLRQAREHVVARVLALLHRELVEVHARIRGRPARSPGSARSGPARAARLMSSQWRICWRSPSGTPSMREITSTGNGAEKSATASNSSASFNGSRKPRMTSRIIGSSAVDGARREHPAHERSQPVVLRRIHHDDAAGSS